ncbi:MAG: hypothetical protein LPK13_09380 [Marinobacter sp.]|nr:hypothetical protein [Marinobacter sp.]MDX5472711.1 hypothetical protein [Marinobacter sp.]
MTARPTVVQSPDESEDVGEEGGGLLDGIGGLLGGWCAIAENTRSNNQYQQ